MTSETKSFIELADIIAFHFECRNCHATATRTIADLQRWPTECSNCGTDWCGLDNQSTKKILEDFALQLKAASRTSRDKQFLFRLEVAPRLDYFLPLPSQKEAI